MTLVNHNFLEKKKKKKKEKKKKRKAVHNQDCW